MDKKYFWYQLETDEVFNRLNSSTHGLAESRALEDLKQEGPNEIESKQKEGFLKKFFKQFASPLIYILLAAAIITFFLEEYIDSVVILGVVLANAVLGFAQEKKAENALQALSNMIVPETKVIRDNTKKTISSRDLVPGDVVLLESGDRVPADLRLFYVKNMTCDEAPLTGESIPVDKSSLPLEERYLTASDQKNMAFAGTYVTQGIGKGIVVSTGKYTEIGKISESIRESKEIKTPLIKKIEYFGILLSIAILAAAIFTFVVGLLRGLDILETFLASVSLAVAAIPEGLPATLTITLALGVKAMASRNAIIRSMPSVETLGSATVICSDKTGTLTKNQMTVTQIYTSDGNTFEITGVGYDSSGDFLLTNNKVDPYQYPTLIETLKAGYLCNESSYNDGVITGDPTEGALLIAAKKISSFELNHKQVDIIPFESERRFMATLNEDENGKRVIYVKGSPEKILEHSDHYISSSGKATLDDSRVTAITNKADEMASLGLRVIGLAYLEIESNITTIEPLDISNLTFVGLQGMIDPPREEVKESIKKCKSAGIRVIMITGDHVLTASAIGRKLGIDSEGAISGSDIDKLSDEDVIKTLKHVSVFARTSPEHKLRIVNLLQSQGEIVAVTGDGINDAPALKSADIGISMGRTGTEVSRDASDMVLTDDNFATIVAAIEEGRDVYSKIQKIMGWLLPTNVGLALIVMVAIILGLTLPLLPVQVLWINMVTAVFLGVPIAMEQREKNLLKTKPRPPSEPLLLPLIKRRIALVGLLMVLGAFTLFSLEIQNSGDIDKARTIVLNTIICFQIFYLFNTKSMYDYVFKNIFTNRYMWFGIATTIILQTLITFNPTMNFLFGTAPLTFETLIIIIPIASSVFFIVEFEKYLYKKFKWNQN